MLRHGQSTWNVEGRLQGQSVDVELSPMGISQAHVAAKQISDFVSPGSPVFTSDLTRAVQTAEIVAAALGSELILDERLREQGLGDMEGRFSHELVALPTPAGQHISEVRWSGGESVQDVYQRSLAFLHDLPTGLDSAVVVGHGDALRIMHAALSGRGHRDIDYQQRWENARPVTVQWPP